MSAKETTAQDRRRWMPAALMAASVVALAALAGSLFFVHYIVDIFGNVLSVLFRVFFGWA